MKVAVRPITIDDADASFFLKENTGQTWEFMRREPSIHTLDAERQYIAWVLSDRKTRMFAVTVEDEYVGWVSLKNIANGAAELSYCILRTDLRNKGIGTAAVGLVIDYGFDRLGLDLIYRYVHEDNKPSLAMTAKHRFAPVGISYINKKVSRYEMTRTGWRNQKNRKSE